MSPNKDTLKQNLYEILPGNTINCLGFDVDVDEDGAFMTKCNCDECKATVVAEAVTDSDSRTDLVLNRQLKAIQNRKGQSV